MSQSNIYTHRFAAHIVKPDLSNKYGQIVPLTIISYLFILKIIRRKYELARRITIMLDEDLAKKLRMLQAKSIHERMENISFSEVLNQAVKAGLKSMKK